MHVRTPNVFERILLIVGILILLVGYGLIWKVMRTNPTLTWESLIAIFLWLILFALVVVTAVAENTKEELRQVIENQFDEMKIMEKKK